MFTHHQEESSKRDFFNRLDTAMGITRTSRSGMPTFFYAVSTEDEGLVRKILNSPDKKFDINAKIDGKRQKQYTALHVAAKLTTNPNIVKLLLKSGHGADVTVRDKRGYTPLDWCFERMKEHPDSTPHSDLLVLRRIFLELLEHKADINSKDNSGRTILDKASECQWVVQDKGFDPGDCMMVFLVQNGAR